MYKKCKLLKRKNTTDEKNRGSGGLTTTKICPWQQSLAGSKGFSPWLASRTYF